VLPNHIGLNDAGPYRRRRLDGNNSTQHKNARRANVKQTSHKIPPLDKGFEFTTLQSDFFQAPARHEKRFCI
jgi:hypothetical protein